MLQQLAHVNWRVVVAKERNVVYGGPRSNIVNHGIILLSYVLSYVMTNNMTWFQIKTANFYRTNMNSIHGLKQVKLILSFIKREIRVFTNVITKCLLVILHTIISAETKQIIQSLQYYQVWKSWSSDTQSNFTLHQIAENWEHAALKLTGPWSGRKAFQWTQICYLMVQANLIFLIREV